MAKPRKPAAPPADPPRIQTISLDALVPDPANVRKRTDRNRATIRTSLKRFGAGRSVLLDRDNVLIAGNGVAEQAAEAGITEVLVIEPRPDQLVAVRRPDLTKTEATALAIADNRAAEQAEWHFEDLAKQLDALQTDGLDLAEIGWDPHEVEPLLAADWSPPPPGEMPDGGSAGGGADSKGDHPHTVYFEPEKFAVIKRACDRVREIEKDEELSTARCLELICGDWLNDPNWHEAAE